MKPVSVSLYGDKGAKIKVQPVRLQPQLKSCTNVRQSVKKATIEKNISIA